MTLSIEDPAQTALLVLDMQNDFLRADGKRPVDVAQVPALIEHVNAAIAEAGARGIAVVHIANEFPRRSLLNLLRSFCAIAGSDGAKLDDRVCRDGAAYVPKERGDAFTNPALEALLAERGVRHVVLAGVFADHCVLSTARGAIARGYRVSVLARGVAGASRRATTRGLHAMEALGATILRDEAIHA
jgi:nicotinamidase-related amidase